MKQFTITKTGYSAGVYGCTGEYFTLILSSSHGMYSREFYGMYGAEERVTEALKAKGWKEYYTQSNYGRLTRKDIAKNTLSEHSMLEVVKAMKKGNPWTLEIEQEKKERQAQA